MTAVTVPPSQRGRLDRIRPIKKSVAFTTDRSNSLRGRHTNRVGGIASPQVRSLKHGTNPKPLKVSPSTAAKVPDLLQEEGDSTEERGSPASLLRNLRQSYIRRGHSSQTETHLYQGEPRVRLQENAKRRCTPIKFGKHQDENVRSNHMHDSTDEEDYEMDEGRPRVQFQSHVSVIEIPSRFAYSEETASSLWNSRAMLRKMVAKNAIEYAYEKGDWRSAAEEDEFYQLDGSNKMIHPAHVIAVETTPAPVSGHGCPKRRIQRRRQYPPRAATATGCSRSGQSMQQQSAVVVTPPAVIEVGM